MKAFCITLPESPERKAQAIDHFKGRIEGVQFINGIHALTFGLITTHPYDVDQPNWGNRINSKQVGCFLSHYMLWMALSLLPDEKFLILEDDVDLPSDWQERTQQALYHTPNDADMLYLGSCCTEGRPKTNVSENIWKVEYPLCTHAYIVWAKAIPRLLETQRKCFAPVDLALYFNSLPHLKVYTVLPRIAAQRGTEIQP